MLAWHFLSKDERLGYDDGRLVEVGQTLECEGTPELCENGMHGSVRLIDALGYASGPIICRVEIEGDVIEGDDKLCGRRRTVLWWLDATRILHEFACRCAEDALSKVAQPDKRSVAAIAAKRQWLRGEITDGELDAAAGAAWAAVDAAADAPAEAAALAAARAAARAAALADALAAVGTAWAAASAAARAAALADALAAVGAARAAAWADARAAALAAVGAARAAALAAAGDQQDARLTEMVMEAHEATQ